MSSELKVGALFFIGLGLMTSFVFFFSSTFQRHGKYLVRFDRITRLQSGDAVTYNGVKVGTVTAVRPTLEKNAQGEDVPAVEVEYSIVRSFQPSVLVGPQSQYRIDQGLLGGAALAILSKGGAPIMPPMDMPPKGIDPVSIDETMASINSIVEDNRRDIRATIQGAKNAVQHVGEMSEQIRDLVKENRPQVTTTLTNIGDMSGSIRDLIRRNADTLTQAIAKLKQLEEDADDIVQSNRERISVVLTNIAATAKVIGDVVGENRENVRKTIAGLGALAPRLDRIGGNLELITGQIAAGKGTIGKLVMEDTLHDKAVQAVENLNQRMEELKPVTGPLASLKIWGTIETGYDAHSGVTDTYAMVRLEPRPWKFYTAGVSYRTAPKGRATVPENPDKLHIDFNILLGWRFIPDDRDQIYHLTLAGGLIDSQLGGYAQVPVLPHWLDLVVMARQKDSKRLTTDRRYEDGSALARAYLRANVWHERVFLIAGGNDLIDHPGLWLGVRGELLDNDLRNMVGLTGLAP